MLQHFYCVHVICSIINNCTFLLLLFSFTLNVIITNLTDFCLSFCVDLFLLPSSVHLNTVIKNIHIKPCQEIHTNMYGRCKETKFCANTAFFLLLIAVCSLC